MVVKRQCSFCAAEIEPGTGSMYVKRDGTVYHFCSSSCHKQQLDLGRVGHRFKWTRAHALKVAADRSSAQRAAAPPTSREPIGGSRTLRGGRRPATGPTAAEATPPAAVKAPLVPAAVPAGEEAPTTAVPAEEKKPKRRGRTRKKADRGASEE